MTCVAPGLYEIQLGFFSRRKPVVKLHVNGEVGGWVCGKHAVAVLCSQLYTVW